MHMKDLLHVTWYISLHTAENGSFLKLWKLYWRMTLFKLDYMYFKEKESAINDKSRGNRLIGPGIFTESTKGS